MGFQCETIYPGAAGRNFLYFLDQKVIMLHEVNRAMFVCFFFKNGKI